MVTRIQIVKYRLLKQCRKMSKGFRQNARDVQYWNSINPQHVPMDVGADLARANIAEQIAAFVNDNKPIPDTLWDRLLEPFEQGDDQ